MASTQVISLILSLITMIIAGGKIISLFLLLPNPLQRKYTHEDTAGWGIAAFGGLLAMISVMFSIGVFAPEIRGYQLGTYFATLFAFPAGMAIFFGVLVGLKDKYTDPFLDQKNIKWLALAVALVVIILWFLI